MPVAPFVFPQAVCFAHAPESRLVPEWLISNIVSARSALPAPNGVNGVRAAGSLEQEKTDGATLGSKGAFIVQS